MDIVLTEDFSRFKKGELLLNVENSAARGIIVRGKAREASLEDLAVKAPKIKEEKPLEEVKTESKPKRKRKPRAKK